MAWIAGNRALNLDEMNNNAREFWNFFSAQGFTLNSVSGMLGNGWRESTLNPGIWQNRKVNYKMGYGFFQWTPASKVIDWLKQNKYAIDSGEGQCKRVMWEYKNGQQYYKTKSYPLTFPQFAQSERSVEYLVRVFFANYERGNPDKADMAGRIKWGEYFYEYLQGEPVEPP